MRATSDPPSSSMGLLILASFQANSHSPHSFFTAFDRRHRRPKLCNVVCRHPARARRRHYSLPSPSSRVCPPPMFSCSFLTIIRSVDWVTQHKHKCLPSPWPHACLSTPAGCARAIARRRPLARRVNRSLGVGMEGRGLGRRRNFPQGIVRQEGRRRHHRTL